MSIRSSYKAVIQSLNIHSEDMRNSAAMIAELEQGGVMSYSELSSFFFRYKRKDDHTDELEKLKNIIDPIEELFKKMKYHDTLVPVYREYKSKTGWSQSRFRKKNAEQIEAYEKTSAYIKEHIKSYYVDGKPPTIGDLMDMSNKLKTQYDSLLPEHNAFLTKKAVAGKYTKVVKNYVNEKEMKRRREISNQKIKQKKKGVWLE